MGKGLQGRRDKVFLMTKVCTYGRDASLAMQMLEQSLTRLQTDHLDLWQVHGVSFENDPELFMRPGGAAEAMRKSEGPREGALPRIHGSQRSGDAFKHAEDRFSFRRGANASKRF
jgi:aryl-alcohol dehydrogenase-like predicted oxidoreductase